MPDFAHDLADQIPRLRRYARALTHNAAWADDLVQDTLERALRHRWRFSMNSNLTAWLMTMLYRLYLNQASHLRTPMAVVADDAPDAEISDDTVSQLDIQNALASLGPEQRAVIVLIGLEQLSYK
jgi:RNA polymerase sigma-70 factor (ECF subfamily)